MLLLLLLLPPPPSVVCAVVFFSGPFETTFAHDILRCIGAAGTGIDAFELLCVLDGTLLVPLEL